MKNWSEKERKQSRESSRVASYSQFAKEHIILFRDGWERTEKKREKLRSRTWRPQPPPSAARPLSNRRCPFQTPQAHVPHFLSLPQTPRFPPSLSLALPVYMPIYRFLYLSQMALCLFQSLLQRMLKLIK